LTLRYLPEHAESASLALDVARKEAAYLQYTHDTLFLHPVDAAWVRQLEQRPDLAEKVDVFVARFGRLQDQIGERLIPRFAALVGEAPRSLLDCLAHAERMGWIDSAEAFIGARKLRNLLVHEYMSDVQLFLQALLAAREATEILFSTVARIDAEATSLVLAVDNLPDNTNHDG
jgi:hypothetical protein